MQRPHGITAVTVLLGIAAFPSLFTLNYKSDAFGSMLVGVLLAAVTIAIVLGNFWHGFDWARLLVLLECLLQFVFPLRILRWAHEHRKVTINSHFALALAVCRAVIAIYLLWYLNTREVRDWFDPKPTDK